jgi:hypothetical protein
MQEDSPSHHGEQVVRSWSLWFRLYPAYKVFQLNDTKTLTFDPWPWKTVRFFLSSWWSSVLSYMNFIIIYGFTSRSRIFHLYGDVTITGEGLQNLVLCSALRVFEQGGIFPAVTREFGFFFRVSSKGPPHSVASYDTQGDVEDLLPRSLQASYDTQGDAENLFLPGSC